MSKAFRLAHPDKARTYDAAYYAAHRERYADRNTRYKASTAGILADNRSHRNRRTATDVSS